MTEEVTLGRINEKAVMRLQREIDVCLERHGMHGVSRIELAKGSEVTDLTANADLRVYVQDDQRFRISSCLTGDCLRYFTSGPQVRGNPRPDMDGIYTTGGPVVVVREISGDSIVRAVSWYLEKEGGRRGL